MPLAGQNPHLPLIAGLVLAGAVYLTLDRAIFLMGAAEAQAEVRDLRAEDADCGKGRHQCTKFMLVVSWAAGAEPYEAAIEVGDARGYGARLPADLGYAIGDAVPLLFDPDDPSEHYLAGRNDLWRTPLIAWALGAVLGLAAVAGRMKLF